MLFVAQRWGERKKNVDRDEEKEKERKKRLREDRLAALLHNTTLLQFYM